MKGEPKMGNISASRALKGGVAVWAALWLVACGGGGGGATANDPAGEPASLSVSRPGELTAYVQSRLRQRPAGGAMLAGDVQLAPTAGASPVPRSSTTLQEAGVDEPDLLQGRGDAFFALSAKSPAEGGPAFAEVQAWRRGNDGVASRAAALALPSDEAVTLGVEGMVLSDSGQALAVLSQRWHRSDGGGVICHDLCPADAVTMLPFWWFRSSVAVHRVDVTDASAPKAGERLAIDGQLVAARRVGDQLVLVTTWVPQLPVDRLPPNATAAEREAAIASTTPADILPRMRRNGGAPTALLGETDCWTQPGNASTDVQVTTITLLDLRAADLAPRSRCFVGGTQALYMTSGSLYLATTRWVYATGIGGIALVGYPADMRTDIHKFAFGAQGVSYRASGDVPGHLGWDARQSSYRFSEWNGDLRVVTFTGTFGWAGGADPATPPSPAQLSVLRERAGQATLQTVATLPNTRRPELLGKPGEQLRAVRFVGDRGYVVTFRQIDPLYVLDLADPADPKTAGALEVPGFSDHLLPLADGLLLGVGRDVDPDTGRNAGLKLALFDVRDAARPLALDSVTLGRVGSMSALDASPHGINWLTTGGVARVALPVALATTGDYSGWQRGLQRLEVDLTARSLRMLPLLDAVSESPWAVGDQRSLQIGSQLYHWRDGALASHAW